MERLQKVIAYSGVCSRRKAEQLILEGRVKVNGYVVKELGTKVNFSDSIEIDGEKIKLEETVVYILNKPKNIISSASDEKGRTTVVDLIDCKNRLYPLGRLDYNSSGLILLSNDGKLMNRLIHPKNKVEKVYEVVIDGIISNSQINKLENGVVIDNYKTAPCKIKLNSINENKKTSFLTVTIHEGKNRQIRKMFNTQGFNVIKLHRVKEANIELGNLKTGEYRRLKPFELKILNKYLDGNNI